MNFYLNGTLQSCLDGELSANTDEEADDDPTTLDENEGNNEDDESTKTLSMEEVKQAITELKNNEAPGDDNSDAETWSQHHSSVFA